MNRLNTTANASLVEQEVNNEIKNLGLDVRDVVVFAEINNLNLYPLETYIDQDDKIVIDDCSYAKNKDIYLGTRRQFIYKRYTVNSSTLKFDLDESFKTAWNPKYYIIFRNGYKLNPNMYRMKCPSFSKQYDAKTIYSLVRFASNDTLDVFYIESDNDYFLSLDTSKDMIIKTYTIIATSNDQYTIDIPYPYESYDKSIDRFFIFDLRTNTFLKLNTDYTVHTTGLDRYISLVEEKKLSINNKLIFLFPYCITNYVDLDIAQEASNTVINYLKGNGIVNGRYLSLTPTSFNDYTLTKDNSLLFYDDELIDPSTYSINNNNTIDINTGIKSDYTKYYVLSILEYDNMESENPFRSLKIEEIEAKTREY